jgi:hypothetical protein
VDGLAGASVGWGFTVTWTSTSGDWISFTSTRALSLAQAETNPSLLASYTDFIGVQGGPVDFGLSPGASPWTQTFNGVSQGVGLDQIVSNLALRCLAQRTGPDYVQLPDLQRRSLVRVTDRRSVVRLLRIVDAILSHGRWPNCCARAGFVAVSRGGAGEARGPPRPIQRQTHLSTP